VILHPNRRRLEAYADGTLAGARARAVAAHLVRCPRCSRRLDALRSLERAAAGLAAPAPDPTLIDRALARRVAGERLILPAAGVPLVEAGAGGRRRRWAGRGIAAAAALALLVVATRNGELAASTSDLQFRPAQPTAGAAVEARYRPGSALAGEARVALRARLRAPDDEMYESGAGIPRIVAILERQEDGSFRGSFQLPDSVVYALLVVEDEAATVIDTNQRRGWELLVHDAAGTPVEAALQQRSHDMMGRNWELAYETARRRAELYPGLFAWSSLRFFESAALGTEDHEERAAAHRAWLGALHDSLAPLPALDGDVAGAMMWYAYGAQDTSLIAYWEERFEREHPAHPLAVQNRVVYRIGAPNRDRPARALELLEALWDEVGYRHGNQFNVALQYARRLGDVAALQRWYRRSLEQYPASAGSTGAAFVAYPELREDGMALLRERIGVLDRNAPERRRLFRTLVEQEEANRTEQRRWFAALGRALHQTGHTQAALDTLRLAVDAGWDTDLFRTVADVRHAAGDAAGAVELWARVAVDPTTAAVFADSARARAPLADWAPAIDLARAEMHRRTLAGSVTRALPRQLAVLDADGRRRNLHDLFDGRPGAIVYWSRNCGPALDALPSILRVAERLRADSTPFILLVDAAPSDELRAYFEENRVDMPIAYDSRGEVMRALVAFGTPTYFVLDGQGRVRFEEAELGALPRLVATLRDPVALGVEAGR
jgi:hypothetical protein